MNATMPEPYEIKLRGQLDQRWSESFAGLKFTYLEGDVRLLSGLLERIRDLNLTLLSVTCGTPSTQDADKNNKE